MYRLPPGGRIHAEIVDTAKRILTDQNPDRLRIVRASGVIDPHEEFIFADAINAALQFLVFHGKDFDAENPCH